MRVSSISEASCCVRYDIDFEVFIVGKDPALDSLAELKENAKTEGTLRVG